MIRTKSIRKKEEIANSLSHAIGVPLAVAGLVLLVVYGAIYGNAWHVVSYSIFGVSLILLYTASSVFHGARRVRIKYHLNKFDHSAIYILIAGSYTPIALISLNGTWGWILFGLIWGFAILGIIYKIFFYSAKLRWLSTAFYVMMGWLVIIAINQVLTFVPEKSLWFLLAGGLSYSLGAVFYSIRKVPYFHFVFHLFILGGSICHFFSFLFLLNF
jgi:hemolysin III